VHPAALAAGLDQRQHPLTAVTVSRGAVGLHAFRHDLSLPRRPGCNRSVPQRGAHARSSSRKHGDVVTVELAVCGQDGDIEDLRLSDQKSMERVTVVIGPLGHPKLGGPRGDLMGALKVRHLTSRSRTRRLTGPPSTFRPRRPGASNEWSPLSGSPTTLHRAWPGDISGVPCQPP